MNYMLLLGITLAAFVAGTYADCHGGCGDDFNGFGTEPGKCGCCPWPCCCKCVEVATGDCGDLSTTSDIECPCVDLTFLVDASGSVSPFVWAITMQFVTDVLNFTMKAVADNGCQDIINMAMITFGDNATLHWGLTPAGDVINDIVNVPQAKKFTNLVEAMELAINSVYSSGSDCIPYAVIITDGRANFREQQIGPMGADMRAAVDDNLVCIGITTAIDEDQLNLICPDGYITLSDQSGLVQGLIEDITDDVISVINDAVKPVCESKEECFCCCPPSPEFGMMFHRAQGSK